MESSMDIRQMKDSISADCIVQGVIDRYPQTITVFARHGLQCVGCYIAPFHTIADSAREHTVPLEILIADLNRALVSLERTR
jgi:hybrid cluster-associated redox disulfide protein